MRDDMDDKDFKPFKVIVEIETETKANIMFWVKEDQNPFTVFLNDGYDLKELLSLKVNNILNELIK
jgi:hypothetical protein